MLWQQILDAYIRTTNGLAGGLTFLKNAAKTSLEVNNCVMAAGLQFAVDLFSQMWHGLQFIFTVIFATAAFFLEFVVELINFTQALLFLVWKIAVIIYSFLVLVFHFVECLFYFIWTGGKWTAETIRISGRNLTENSLSTWKHFVISLQELTNSLIHGFTHIGTCAKSFLWYMFDFVCNAYYYTCEGLTKIDQLVKDCFRSLFDNVYFFTTEYLFNMPTEAYLGILVTILCAMICRNIVKFLTSEGLTFPTQGWFTFRRSADEIHIIFDDDDNYVRAEFSDDDDVIDLTLNGADDDESDDGSVHTDSSGSSNGSNYDNEFSDEEMTIGSDSDSESVAPSEMSEINIQLPDSSHRLQRSDTPSRFNKDMTAEDVQRFVESEKERRMCVVCQDRTKSVLVLPCRHMCMCVECGNMIARSRSRESRRCPLCRTKINTIMNVYV